MDVKMIENKGEGSTKWAETADLPQTMTYSQQKELSLTPTSL